ncbi:sentrin-specific protease 7b isoform X2 [Thalassophryne amazonica]|uniref:sentrin-specific protease 7b isoform X2 n=1 Tax=Thalassophryne amazonica TaxID=390379 RepID=UPI0014721146|nr:sentrin-specific protease 7b isoform X2 [Thalassophryne amazonica]
MASTFKIPKRKQPAGDDTTHMQSPLSRLQNSAADIQSSWGRSSRGGADVMHAGNSAGGRQSSLYKPPFGRVVRTLLRLNSPGRVPSAANHSADYHSAKSTWNRQLQPGHRVQSEMAASCWSNRWRPKRASDRLLEPGVTSQCLPSTSTIDSYKSNKSICVQAVDSLAELRGKEHDGSLRNNPQRWAEPSRKKQDSAECDRRSPEAPQEQLKKNSFAASSSDQNSDDDFVSPARARNQTSADKNAQSAAAKPSSLSSPSSKVKLKRTSWLAANPRDDPTEKKRENWKEFRDRKQRTGTTSLHLRLRLRHKSTASEPIVLSSEEEDDSESEEKSEINRVNNNSLLENSTPKKMKVSSSRAETDEPPLPPSFLQLDFDSLHMGLMNANANGKMMITENGITIPLKGAEEGEVCVVAPQVRGYGLWDGGVAHGGTLLAHWEGPASSLLFLWVTEEQANVLHRELLAIRPPDTAVPPCSFLLLVLKEQLQELHSALLASILDMEGYIRGRASSSVSSPIDWTDGLLLFHSCPPPLDQHLLSLLGHSVEKPKHTRTSSRNKMSSVSAAALQQLPSRLIQYPAAPCKGRITVTKEDLACMDAGEFLNDVIIDFYLKYLLLEGVGGAVAERSHIFSSFFFKQLSRKRAAGEDDSPLVSDCHIRHQRVKTWTRHIDIFTKDFLFVPVNQASHWYLVVICFPGLEEVQHEARRRRTGVGADHRSQQPPECTDQGCQRDSVMKRPCILVMDSLKLSSHENVCKLLRDYLQVEWEVRRGTPRLFTHSTMENMNCRVPLQDNSSDCGLYLLQYVESFLQNPVVHFGFPVRLESWFPQQQVRKKREAIRSLILKMHHDQHKDDDDMRPP